MLVNLKLISDQMQRLKNHEKNLGVWVTADEGKRKVQKHREHEHYFKEMLSSENLKMTNSGFAEIWNNGQACFGR